MAGFLTMDMSIEMPNHGNPQSLLKLLTWLSPAFPIGSFSYSSGLESAIHDGQVHDKESLADWLSDLLRLGPARNDAIFLGLTLEAGKQKGTILDLSDLALALAGSKERYLETTAQGNAFVTAAGEWNKQAASLLPVICPLPIAIGVFAAAESLEKQETQIAFLHAFVSNQVQSALRLMKLGQQNGLMVMKQMEPMILETVERISTATIDDLGSATIMADIASMRHETMPSRIFRS